MVRLGMERVGRAGAFAQKVTVWSAMLVESRPPLLRVLNKIGAIGHDVLAVRGVLPSPPSTPPSEPRLPVRPSASDDTTHSTIENPKWPTFLLIVAPALGSPRGT
jgi:hypothetical protein